MTGRARQACQSAGRYWHTLRHLRPSQVAWRLRYLIERRAGIRPRISLPASAPPLNAAALDRLALFISAWTRHAPPRAEQLAELRADRFTFLGETMPGDPMPPWACASASRLWRYQLHYFEYSAALAADPAADHREADAARVCAWVQDWVACNPPGTDVAWDAFPTAQRLMNLCLAESIFRTDDALLRRSLAQQLDWLTRHLEFDVRANHLLKDAAALVVAGIVLNNVAQAAKGLRLLEREVAEQVLEDGGHYERSPMYHLHVLHDLLLVRSALHAPPAWLDNALARMTRFLAAVLHGDGDIPLFNDAVREPACSGAAMVAWARALLPQDPLALGPLPRALPDTGVYVLGPADDAARMIVKAGAIGPDHQPGHAHADLLSFELSVGATRVLVDSGVHGYAGSPWRAYGRSVRAHNAVCVDGREPIDCWGVFRVGRRTRAHVDAWTGDSLQAHHGGYAPWQHTRRIVFEAPGTWRVEDAVDGPGAVTAESYLHAPPGARFVQSGDGWKLHCEDVTLHIALFGFESTHLVEGQTDPQQGWYAPEFGHIAPAPALVLRTHRGSALRFGYTLSRTT
jgi:uncharacterized heparinase superfamily protein